MPGPGTPIPGGKRYDLSNVSDALDTLTKDQRAQGVMLTAIKGGAIVYRRAFGTMLPGEAIALGEASALPSATLLAALADEGKLSLDDRVSKYIPEFSGEKAVITVRQLLTHTSGLPAEVSAARGAASLAGAAAAIANAALLSAPGSAFRFSRSGYQVAGRIAEVASGAAWESLVKEKLAGPLGLAVLTYGSGRNPGILDGARGSTDDYARILDLQVQNGYLGTRKVLSATAIAAMQTNAIAGLPVEGAPPVPARGYGLGLEIESLTPAGKPALLSAPGQGVYPWVNVELAYCACLAAQGDGANATSLAREIEPLMADSFAKPLD